MGKPLLPEEAIIALENVMIEAVPKHGMDSWRGQDLDYHLMRAERHIQKRAMGDNTEDHLAHAACRLLLALAQRESAAKSQEGAEKR